MTLTQIANLRRIYEEMRSTIHRENLHTIAKSKWINATIIAGRDLLDEAEENIRAQEGFS